MPTDARLGFAVGVSLVIVVAVVAFRAESAATPADPAAINAKPDPTAPAPRESRRKPSEKAAAPSSPRSTQVASGLSFEREGDNSRTPALDIGTAAKAGH